jgi:uncharacterized CHY-type Zn-finger protein
MSPRFADYEHLLRIVVVFLLAGAAFLVWRAWMVPDDFGVYGHYRAGALDDEQRRPLAYAGQAACADCHADLVALRREGAHAGVTCEACHGPLNAHAVGEMESSPSKPDPRAICITCHAAGRGKPTAFPQVVVDEHAPDGECTVCHQAHVPGIS